MRPILVAGGIASLWHPLTVLAQRPCALVGGCSASNPIEQLAPPVLNLLISIAAGLTVLFVIYGGAQMIISIGDESKINQGRMAVVYALIGFGLVLAAQSVVSFVVVHSEQASAGSNPLLSTLDGVINAMLSLFTVVFVIVMIVAGFRLTVGKGGSDQYETAKRMLFWSAVGAVVIHVAKALVYAVLNLGL